MVVFIMFNTRTRCNIYNLWKCCFVVHKDLYMDVIIILSLPDIIGIILRNNKHYKLYCITPFFNLKILGVFFRGGGCIMKLIFSYINWLALHHLYFLNIYINCLLTIYQLCPYTTKGIPVLWFTTNVTSNSSTFQRHCLCTCNYLWII